MNFNHLIEEVQPFMDLVHTFLNCLNGFLYPILGIFALTITLGIAFYIMHRL